MKEYRMNRKKNEEGKCEDDKKKREIMKISLSGLNVVVDTIGYRTVKLDSLVDSHIQISHSPLLALIRKRLAKLSSVGRG